VAHLELLDRDADGHASADQKRSDRGHEGPEEPLPRVPEGMVSVRRLAGAVQADREKHLVDAVGRGVRGLGKHGARPGCESGEQLRDADDEVGGECDDDGPRALAFLGSAQSHGRATLGKDPQALALPAPSRLVVSHG
jgi:hypothetical protein